MSDLDKSDSEVVDLTGQVIDQDSNPEDYNKGIISPAKKLEKKRESDEESQTESDHEESEEEEEEEEEDYQSDRPYDSEQEYEDSDAPGVNGRKIRRRNIEFLQTREEKEAAVQFKDNNEYLSLEDFGDDVKGFYNQNLPDFLHPTAKIFILTNKDRCNWNNCLVDPALHKFFTAKAIGNLNNIVNSTSEKLTAPSLNATLVNQGFWGSKCLSDRNGIKSKQELISINRKRFSKGQYEVSIGSRINRRLSEMTQEIDMDAPNNKLWFRAGAKKYNRDKKSSGGDYDKTSITEQYARRKEESQRERDNMEKNANKSNATTDALTEKFNSLLTASYFTNLKVKYWLIPGNNFSASTYLYTRAYVKDTAKSNESKYINYVNQCVLGLRDSQVNELKCVGAAFLYKGNKSKEKDFNVKRDGNDSQIAPGGINGPGSSMSWVKCTIIGGAIFRDTNAKYVKHNESDYGELRDLLHRRWNQVHKQTEFLDWETDPRKAIHCTVALTATVSCTMLLDDLRNLARKRNIDINTDVRFMEHNDIMCGSRIQVRHQISLQITGGELSRDIELVQPPLWRPFDISNQHKSKHEKMSRIKQDYNNENRRSTEKSMSENGIFDSLATKKAKAEAKARNKSSNNRNNQSDRKIRKKRYS